MTRTLTAPSTGSQTVAAAPPTQADARRSRAGSRNPLRWLAVVVPIVLLLGVTALVTASWRRAASELAGVNKFTVDPRSFSVVLNEKGELKAAKATEIVCEVEGRSTIISLIAEGTAVKEGDLLVELASDQIEDRIQQDELKEANAITEYEAAKTELEIQRDKNASDIRKANLAIELRQLELDRYEKGDWVATLKDHGIDIDQARIKLERRAEDFDAAKKLWERGFITKPQFDEDEFSYQRAQWDLEKAIRAKEILVAYSHVADLRERQSDLEEASKEYDRKVKNAEAEEVKKTRRLEGKKKALELIQSQLAKRRRQREKCRITAPTQGFVVFYSRGGRHFYSSENQIREGATVRERQVLLTLPDTSEMQVVVRIHEAKTDRLHLGQQVRVRVEGLPEEVFTGTVTKIAVVADTQNRWLNPDLKEYETEITLDPTELPLKPGVTAHAEILVGTVENKLAVPVQTIYSKAGSRYVFQANGRTIVPTPIQLGAIGIEWAEVTDGLSGGERILLAFSDEHKRLVPDLPSTAERKNGWRREDRASGGYTYGMSLGAGDAESVSGRDRSGKTEARPAAQTRQHGQSSQEGAGGWMKRIDANADGKIQKDELPEQMRAMFDRIDGNGDGVLDSKELKALAGGSGRPSRDPSRSRQSPHGTNASNPAGAAKQHGP